MNKRILILIISISVITRVAAAFWMGDQILYLPAIFDQYSYDRLATRLLEGYGFTFDQLWWPFTRAGEPTAHWSYLYTYYLAIIYRLFGPHPLPARLIQAVTAGIFMPWLTYRLAARVFPPITFSENHQSPQARRLLWLSFPNHYFTSTTEVIPALAAAWVALYGYFIYFAAALMTETFYILTILWTLDCAMRIGSNINKGNRFLWSWTELGIAMATTVLLRQVFMLFVPVLILWIIWNQVRNIKLEQTQNQRIAVQDTLKRALLGGIVCGLLLILFIAPFTAYNYRQFNRFVILNTNAGYAFFLSNHPSYGTRYQPMLTSGEFRKMIPPELTTLDEAALDQELLKLGLGFVFQDPSRYLLLSISKIPAFFIFWPTETSSVASNISRILSFGLALPFMLLGIGLWIRDVRQKLWPLGPGMLLLLFGGVYTLIHLLSWSGIRYRLPVDACLLIFSAFGLLSVLKWFTPKISAIINH